MKNRREIYFWAGILVVFISVFYQVSRRVHSDDPRVLIENISVLEQKIQADQKRENYDIIQVKEIKKLIISLKKKYNRLQRQHIGFLMGTSFQKELLLKH